MLKPCNKENMTKFVQALESGEYTQCQDALRDASDEAMYRYCCLGVACDVAKKDGVALPYTVWTTHTALPHAVKEWLGIDEANPLLPQESGEVIAAITLNDNLKQAFPLIASSFRYTYLEEDN